MLWTSCVLYLFASFMVFVSGNDQCRTEVSTRGMALKGFVLKRMSASAPHICDFRCEQEIACQSYNYNRGEKICELNNRTKEARPENFRSNLWWFYVRRLSGRAPLGSIPELPALSCQEIKASEGKDTVSDKYWLDPTGTGKAVSMYCDMHSGDECKTANVCDANANCTNTDWSYNCTCYNGFTGNGFTCSDIDECNNGSHVCDVNANCTNIYGSYNCTCKEGYTGDGRSCSDVNECSIGSHVCDVNANCTNTYGSHNCTCKEGYTGDGRSCSDVNECSIGSHVCDVNANCTNTYGSHNCTCKEGYTGDGRSCSAVNDCSDAAQFSGVYKILNHGSEPFPVYCDQKTDGGGWTMVFKVVGNVKTPLIGPLWNSSATLSENVELALDTTSTHFGHYKNRIVRDWKMFNPREARVAFYMGGSEVGALKFNATDTNILHWFSRDNLIDSPWTDLKTPGNSFVFSILGWITRPKGRYFEIMGPYGSCETDTGWLLTTAKRCSWEKRLPEPSIIYSKKSTAVNLETYGDVGVADVLIVYLR